MHTGRSWLGQGWGRWVVIGRRGILLQTIFEINASSKDPCSQVMRAKRQRDRKAIASFQQGRQERQGGPADPDPQKELPQKEEEEDMAETVEVRPAGEAGAGGHTARDSQWYSPMSPGRLWKRATVSAYSAGEECGDEGRRTATCSRPA